MSSTRILLADDQTLFRAGLRCLIGQLDGFYFADDLPFEIEAIEKMALSASDIVAVGINTDWYEGIASIARLRQQFPKVGILLMTMESTEQSIAEAFQAGVSAYLLKSADIRQLESALRAVAANQPYLSPELPPKILRQFSGVAQKAHNPLQSMTGRQLQVLAMIGNRKGIKQIAHELDLSPKTIAAHRTKILEHTGEKDTVGLVLYARKFGLAKSD